MKKKYVVLLITLVFLFPLFYLIYKAKDAAPVVDPVVLSKPNDIPALEKALLLDSGFVNLLALGSAYINAQMPGKSIPLLKKALVLDPQSVVAYNDLGVAYTILQQYQKGIDACTKALRIDTSFQLAKNNLKWATDEKNKILTAIAHQEALPEKDRDGAMELERGLNYFKIGQYDKSIEIWNVIVEKDPKNTSALNNIGTAFMMKEQVQDAIMLFNKVLEIAPDDQLAKNNLAWAEDEKKK